MKSFFWIFCVTLALSGSSKQQNSNPKEDPGAKSCDDVIKEGVEFTIELANRCEMGFRQSYLDEDYNDALKAHNSAKDEGLGACAQTRVRRRIFLVFP
jgi:uncharacterized membrane protein YvbJ